MKKIILLMVALAGFAFASCGQTNCGCQNKESSKESKCSNKESCKELKCSNKTVEHKCGSEKLYQSDAVKSISNTSDIIEKK